VDGSGRESVGDLLPRTRRFPTGTNVIYDRADAAITTVKPDELPTNAVEEAEWFHTTGITPALSEAAAETTTALLQRAGDAGTTRSFDLNYRSKLWDPQTARAAYEDLFEHVDTLFVPRRDARKVLDREGDAVEIAHGLATEFAFNTVIVTRGLEGQSRCTTDRCTSRTCSRRKRSTRSVPATRSSAASLQSACAVVTSRSPPVGVSDGGAETHHRW